ncbi:hypothetical protein FHS48_000462 [Novispirillum itersonii]|uniref:Uncharacterized protein n=1 Tax=Novispirillum itersonii TaxID=189 RepID=A0A7W9ZCR3_NOVIT|nr:hypothetical protein [Novispirillum itersonii]
MTVDSQSAKSARADESVVAKCEAICNGAAGLKKCLSVDKA